MKKNLKLFLGILFILTLTGCFGEDYDVGVPTAYLQLDTGLRNQQIKLTEANISWSSSSVEVVESNDDIEEFGLSQDEIRVSPNQDASLEFKENEENGGDIWTDPTISTALWKDGEETNVELNDFREFQFPTNEGNYVLEVEFIDTSNEAQYVGNIVIEETIVQTKVNDGQLPDFTLMEMPSIIKIDSADSNGVPFDNSYSEVCWKNCSDNSTYNYPDFHSGDAEVGDKILIDWGMMKPNPTEVNLIHINSAGEKVSEEKVSTDSSTLNIQVGKEDIGKQYSVQYLWQDGRKLIGQSMLNFKIK